MPRLTLLTFLTKTKRALNSIVKSTAFLKSALLVPALVVASKYLLQI